MFRSPACHQYTGFSDGLLGRPIKARGSSPDGCARLSLSIFTLR
jgi:hypothetical protein